MALKQFQTVESEPSLAPIVPPLFWADMLRVGTSLESRTFQVKGKTFR